MPGGADLASVQWIEVSVSSGPRVQIGSATERAAVEQSVSVQGLAWGQNHAIAVGHLTDGQDQVVRYSYI